MNSPKRYKLIACEIMFREICLCAARCEPVIDIKFMSKGLHDIGEQKMSAMLQKEIDDVDANEYDAILLGYGLCNNGIRGMRAPVPLVIPRAHDCIALLMGSKEKYREYFDLNPGTYFKSSGWIERDVSSNQTDGSITMQLGINHSREEYAELYGEENADFLNEILGSWLGSYQQVTYIDTGTGSAKMNREATKSFAAENNWKYDEIQGDTGLLFRLLNGDWNDSEFLVLSPEHKIEPSHDNTIVKSTPI